MLEVKKMKFLKITAAVFFVFIILSTAAVTFACQSVTETNEHFLNVGKGSDFTISLESNPGSTGYDWIVSAYDAKYLKLVSNQFIQPIYMIPGAPGVRNFTFKAIKKGQTTIVLQYLRSWENCLPARKEIYHINIV